MMSMMSICMAVMIVGGVHLVFQVYKMVEMDAVSRGLKHPKFWGFFAMNGNNSAGLLMYLIGRRRYPLLDDRRNEEIEKRKKRAGVGLIFLAVGAIGLVTGILLYVIK